VIHDDKPAAGPGDDPSSERPQRRRHQTATRGRVESLKARLSSLKDSRYLEIMGPLLAGLGIAILAALIMRYV
jgi:hypothetical protein